MYSSVDNTEPVVAPNRLRFSMPTVPGTHVMPSRHPESNTTVIHATSHECRPHSIPLILKHIVGLS